jgi:general secretion pathway protein G
MPYSSQLRIRTDRAGRRGFTLLEVMAVIAIVLILLGMAAVRYERSLLSAREATLKVDLRTMRDAIQQFTLDKQQAPQSLDDLVSSGYLREIPTDPIVRTREWHSDFDNVQLSPDQSGTGVTDVHSTSSALSLDGSPYSSW